MTTTLDFDFEDTRIKINDEYVRCPAGLGLEHLARRVVAGDAMQCPCCDKRFILILEAGLDFPVWKPEAMIKQPQNSK